MAVFTSPSESDLAAIVSAHGLGPIEAIAGVAAGSVNSNFTITIEKKPLFLRVYEEQGAGGVDWEWALLDHFRGGGVPVPGRLVPTREVLVQGKPIAIFEWVGGDECCQKRVTQARMTTVGRWLGRIHGLGIDFAERASRYSLADMAVRFDTIEAAARAEHLAVLPKLRSNVAELGRWPNVEGLPKGVTHGDLFRDNVRWSSETEVSCILDWDSASTGALVYDLAVTALAWCFGDTLDFALIAAFFSAYEKERPLSEAEWLACHDAFRAAATRFTISRITDYSIREGVGERVIKDWRRFYARLQLIESFDKHAWVNAIKKSGA